MLNDAVNIGLKEVAVETRSDISDMQAQLATFKTKQCIVKWRRATATVKELMERMRRFRQAQVLRKWASAAKYGACLFSVH
jgi:hypothetical protein